jgi:excisionase family DNA binding protein
MPLTPAHSAAPSPSATPLNTALHTADELAVRWQVPTAQVYRLARDGRLPAVRIGRYYRFSGAVIEAWERSGGAAANE